MRVLLVFTIVLLSIVVTSVALAHGADGQTATSGETQPPRREASNSFEALPRILKVGQEVKVRHDAGRATRGKVVSISDTQLVVSRKKWFFRREEQAFAKEAVRSIDIVDSPWYPGAIVGAAAGVGILAAAIEFQCSPSCDKTGSWVIGSMTIGLMSTLAGGAMDGLLNKTIYERPPATLRVTLAPLLGRERIGVMARVHF